MEKTKQPSTGASHELAHEYKKELVGRLTKGRAFSMMTWAVLNVVIAITQIGILALACWALYIVIDIANNKYDDYIVQIIAIAVIILAFIMTITAQVFAGLAKTAIYKLAAEKIQHETLLFTGKHGEYANGGKDKLDAKATQIMETAINTRKTVSAKTILLNVITMGAYEK